MFLHLGGENEVLIKDIVGIFDIKSILKTKIGQQFINYYLENNQIMTVSKEQARSVIITEEVVKAGKAKNVSKIRRIYYSPISAHTLQSRAEVIYD